MKKILIVITTGMAPYGGLTTVMMNYYRAMDRSELKIDFASTNVLCDELRDELKQNNSNYYNLGDRKKCLPIYIYKLKKVLQINQYDVIHVNGNSAMLFELGIAKKIGVPVRIAHCHTSKTSHPFINNILIDEFKKNYTKAVSVSSTAGDWLYGKNNYTILNNAINTEKYRFCKNIRNEYRNKYNLEGKFVVGHVGKLYEPKNHLFLLKIF